MKFSIQSLSGGNREQEFLKKFEHTYFLGSDHEGVTERYSIEPNANELGFGLGVAVAITSVKPKVLFAERQQAIFIGFDSFVAVISLNEPPASEIKYRLLKLDGVFVDMVLLSSETACVIHELGAIVVTKDLAEVWRVSTDLISDWAIDECHKILSLTDADSGAILNLSLSTGESRGGPQTGGNS